MSLNINSDDPNKPTLPVPLSGTGAQGQISLFPSQFDFGAVAKKKTSVETITVTNQGICPNTSLTINTISFLAAPFGIVGGTCAPGKVLKTGEDCSILVQFAPTQAGSFSSVFNISSNDPARPAVTFSLKGGSGPDLVSDLASPLVKRCFNTGRGVRCTISVVLTIGNVGTEVAPPCCVNFYLSDGEAYRQGDLLLMQTDANGVRVGKSETLRSNIALPPGETGTNKYLTVVVNGNHCFVEANEENNIKTYPIPR